MSKSHTPQPYTMHDGWDHLVASILQGHTRADTSLEIVQKAVPARLRGAVSLKKVNVVRTANSTPYPRPPAGERSKSRQLLSDEPVSHQRSVELSKQSQFHSHLDQQHSEKLRLLYEARALDLQHDLSTLQSLKSEQRAAKQQLIREKRSKAELRQRLEKEHREDVKRRSILAAREVLEEKKALKCIQEKHQNDTKKAVDSKELVKRMLQNVIRENDKQLLRKMKEREDQCERDAEFQRLLMRKLEAEDLRRLSRQNTHLSKQSLSPNTSSDSLPPTNSQKAWQRRKQTEKVRMQSEYRGELDKQIQERKERERRQWKEERDMVMRCSNVF